MILSPLIRGQKGEHKDIFGAIHKQGFVRARVDGEIVELQNPDDAPALKKTFAHNIEAIVDRIVLKPEIRSRLADSIETALKLSQGLVIVTVGSTDGDVDGQRLQREVRLPGASGGVAAGTGAAAVQLQLAARGLSRLPRAGHDVRVRSGADRAGRERCRWRTARSRRGGRTASG